MKLTANELEVLKAIDKSEYGEYLTDAVWTFTIADRIAPHIRKTSIPGIVSSLCKKKLLSSHGEGKDQEVGITDAGALVYINTVGRDNVQKMV